MAHQPVSAVIFDYFATLTPSTSNQVWDDQVARVAAVIGVPAATWRAAWDRSFPERITGELGDLASTIAQVAAQCGASPDPAAIARAANIRELGQRELFALRPEAPGVLRELRDRGLRLGVLSDCTIELSRWWSELPVATLVDSRVLSCEVGLRKPDQRLFVQIMQLLHVTPERCLYVGDGGGHELSGASRAGMRAVMLRGPDWYENVAHFREDDWDGAAVASLTEVPGLLAG